MILCLSSDLSRVVASYILSLLFSIDKVAKVSSPVLVIHGTEDEVIDFSHGLAIYERCSRPVEPLWVEGMCTSDLFKWTLTISLAVTNVYFKFSSMFLLD